MQNGSQYLGSAVVERPTTLVERPKTISKVVVRPKTQTGGGGGEGPNFSGRDGRGDGSGDGGNDPFSSSEKFQTIGKLIKASFDRLLPECVMTELSNNPVKELQ